MIPTFAISLFIQCLGAGIVAVPGLSIPGPMVGMLLLSGALIVSPKLPSPKLPGQNKKSVTSLLKQLPLLLVPAGVGIFVTASSISGHWQAVIVSVIVSTILTLAVTGTVTYAVRTR